MDPFTLWLLGSVVAPDAYERVVNTLNTKSAEDRLAKRVHEDVGRYPKGVFRRWYRQEETWRALVTGGQESFETLVNRLVATSKARLLGRALRHAEAEKIVRAAVAGFVGSLDASDAVAITDYRSAQRDALIDRNAEARASELRDHFDTRFDSVESHLEVTRDFDERVGALPAVVRPLLAAIGATTEAVHLVDIASATVPREALVQLTADIPPWLRDANAATLVAAAELCRCYGVHLGAGRLFEFAADRSADRAYYYARAAVELETAGESDRSSELIDQATSLSTAKGVGAITAALAENPARVLELLPEDEALSEPFLLLLRLYGLRATGQFDEVIGFLTSALDRYPESPGLMIELAWAHLQRSQAATATSRTADRQRAMELGLEARRLRRQWRADAGDAARVACQAALLLGAYDRVIEIGMLQPDGNALPSEASNTEVRLSVAQAAIAAGKTDLLRMVVDLVPDGFHRAIIQAEFLLNTDADADALQAAYDVVWDAASDEEHRVLYWLSGAAAGINLRGEAELKTRTDDVPLMVDAQLQIARGEHDAAVQLLRRLRRTEHTTRLLVGALIAVDDIDGAVEELKAAATRFNDTSHLVRAVEILGRQRRLDDAAALAQEALQRVPRVMTEARAFLHEVLVERAGVTGAWGEMAVRSRAWIEDVGASPRNRWHLALALHNGGDRGGAWRIVEEPPPLAPASAHEARLWTVLAAHEVPSPDTADDIIALVEAYPDDEALAEVAVGVFFGRGDEVWGDVHPETVRRYQDLLGIHAVDYGSEEQATVYVLTGAAEEMLERLRPSLEANARAVEEMTEKVRQGWPYGLLASVAHRPYAATLIHRAAGCLPIATVDAARSGAELAVARAALGKTVAVDVSSLVVVGHIRSAWPNLRGAFSRLELPRPAQGDIIGTVEDFRRPAHGTLYFDTAAQAVRGTDSDPEVQARLLEHGEWVADQLADVSVVDWPHLTALSDELDDSFLPWLSALDMAKSLGLPLWCDDIGIRTLAANDNVSTFGTTALITALAETSAIQRGTAQALLRQLREAYAVDLPLDADWLKLSAGSGEWRPGPSAFYFARPAAWVAFETVYSIWSELAQAAAEAEPIRVTGWVHAAALGLASAVDPGRAPQVLAAIAAKGTVLADFDPEAIAACAGRVREVALAAGIQNPVPHLMATLLEHLTAAIGAQAAARLIMSEHLANEDRSVVRDLVFGITPGPGPSEP
jgi:tetratricopeptide (TPR) repeat protein